MLLLFIFFPIPLTVNAASVRNNGPSSRSWISKAGDISDSLMNIQAFLIKDEDIKEIRDCRTKKNLNILGRRYLMCAGSILTPSFVLTSASCTHEATYIRHNIRGTLSVMIAPFEESIQIIPVIKFDVHPLHQMDPRDISFSLHNVALVKLSCRILDINYKPVILPVTPLDDLCSRGTCTIAIITKINMFAFTVYETKAKNINYERYPRQILDPTKVLRANASQGFHSDEPEQLARLNKSRTEIFASLEKISNANVPVNTNNSKLSRSIEDNNVVHDKITSGLIDTVENSTVKESLRNKKISVRSSDGTNGCALSGSAVMYNNVQGGLVAMACDDRQPDTPWVYTDLYNNLEWIKERTNPRTQYLSNAENPPCTYINNFVFGEQRGGANSMPKLSSPTPPIHTSCGAKISRSNDGFQMQYDMGNSPTGDLLNNNEDRNQAYKDLVSRVYLNNNRKFDDVDGNNKITKKNSNNMLDTFSNTNAIESMEATQILSDSSELIKNSESAPIDDENPSHSRNVADTSSEMHKNLNTHDLNDDVADNREEKPIDAYYYIKNRNNIPSNNEFNFFKENKKLSFEDYFKDNQYEESKIPTKYLLLYRKFLEEQENLKHKNKLNYNF